MPLPHGEAGSRHGQVRAHPRPSRPDSSHPVCPAPRTPAPRAAWASGAVAPPKANGALPRALLATHGRPGPTHPHSSFPARAGPRGALGTAPLPLQRGHAPGLQAGPSKLRLCPNSGRRRVKPGGKAGPVVAPPRVRTPSNPAPESAGRAAPTRKGRLRAGHVSGGRPAGRVKWPSSLFPPEAASIAPQTSGGGRSLASTSGSHCFDAGSRKCLLSPDEGRAATELALSASSRAPGALASCRPGLSHYGPTLLTGCSIGGSSTAPETSPDVEVTPRVGSQPPSARRFSGRPSRAEPRTAGFSACSSFADAKSNHTPNSL